jgi:hypothetical protein
VRKWLLAATLLLALAPSAAGKEPDRLVLIAPADSDLARRLQAEAVAAGLELIVEPATRAGETPAAPADRHRAVGVIRVVAPTAVELYLRSREGKRASYESLTAVAGEDESFALRIAEEIRARLVALELPARAAPEETGAPASGVAAVAARTPATGAEQGARPPRPGIDVGVGIAVSKAAGGIGAGLAAALALRLRFASGWGASAQALVPVVSNRVSGVEGSADVRAYMLAGQVDRVVWRGGRSWAALGAGAGGLLLAMEGEAASGFLGNSDTLAVAVLLADGELNVQLGSWLALRLTLLAGAALPRPVIRFDNREVAAWGRPFAAAVIAFDFRAP